MAMAMELACSRSCSISTWGASSSGSRRAGASTRASGRPQWARTGGRRRFRVWAGEEVGTEKLESEERSIGNFERPPQQQRKWTGYVEKDTAGQTNIYAVEPTVYVAESVFSTNEAGKTPSEGATSTLPIAIALGFVALAGAATVLVTVTQNAPVSTNVAVGYDGPPLSYYIAKFTPKVAVEASVAPELTTTESSSSDGDVSSVGDIKASD